VIVTSERAFEALGEMEGFTALPGVAQTPAGQSGRILVFEDLYLLGLGPRTGALVDELFATLHPDAAS
jgi:iron complex transport system substrate-binding protein